MITWPMIICDLDHIVMKQPSVRIPIRHCIWRTIRLVSEVDHKYSLVVAESKKRHDRFLSTVEMSYASAFRRSMSRSREQVRVTRHSINAGAQHSSGV